MNDLAAQALKDYGLVGFIVVMVLAFCGWLFHKTLLHFIKSIEKKDDRMAEMGSQFREAFIGNTNAIQRLNEAVVKLSDTTENIVDNFERFILQNKDDHREILDHIRINTMRVN